jgi:hypothetical protein
VDGEEDPIYNDSDNNKEILNGDGGTTLAVQKNMLSPKDD